MSEEHNESPKTKLFVFPSWHNRIPAIIFLGVGPIATVFAIFGVWYWFSPKFTDAGYMPEQPVAYSHELHAGQLKIDCRYCHVGVEKTAKAGVPPTQTCMNCHTNIKTRSPKLELVRKSYAEDAAIPWVRIHKIADYAYFPHNSHVRAGVGCESCHGRIDTMVEVWQEKPLSMTWCYECHQAGQEAYNAEREIQQILTEDLRAKRDKIMKSVVDNVAYVNGETLIKQDEARKEVARLNAEIRATERAPHQLAQLKQNLSQSKAVLAAEVQDPMAKTYEERRAKNISQELELLEGMLKKKQSPELAALRAKSDELFAKFVKVANLRPSRKVTAMGYELTDSDYNEIKNRHQGELVPPIHCSGCHR